MHTNANQLFLLYPHEGSNVKVVVWASGREDAKRKAEAGWLRGLGNSDKYIVTPITNPGDRVKLDVTLNV